MHRVPHLVEAVLFRLAQPAFSVESVVLEKKTNLVAGLDEVAVVELGLFRRRKHASYGGRIERANELQGSLAQPVAVCARYEIAQDNEAGRSIGIDHLVGQDAAGRRIICGYSRIGCYNRRQKGAP